MQLFHAIISCGMMDNITQVVKAYKKLTSSDLTNRRTVALGMIAFDAGVTRRTVQMWIENDAIPPARLALIRENYPKWDKQQTIFERH